MPELHLRLEPLEPGESHAIIRGSTATVQNSADQYEDYRIVLRTKHAIDSPKLHNIVDYIGASRCPVVFYSNHDTSHPLSRNSNSPRRGRNVRAIERSELTMMQSACEDLGIKYEILDVTQFHLLPIPTFGQMVLEPPSCGCYEYENYVDNVPCPHVERGEITGGEVDGLLPTSLREER